MPIDQQPNLPETSVERPPLGLTERMVDYFRSKVNSVVRESHLPTQEEQGFKSTVGIYGGKLLQHPDGKMVFDMSGIFSRVDRYGDRVLRTVDEHHWKNPEKMLKRMPPSEFLRRIFAADAKRFRGNPEQIMENVRRLGLEEFYGPAKNGIEVKRPEVFTKGVSLQDIFKQDVIDSPAISGLDRFDAVEQSAKYIKSLHMRSDGIGEICVSDVIFQRHDGKHVSEPVWNIPDIVYNPDKDTHRSDKIGTDMLDFLVNIAVEEWRRSKDEKSVRKILDTAIAAYDDPAVVETVLSFAKRGRLTLAGDQDKIPTTFSSVARKTRDYLAVHNTQRMGVSKDDTSMVRAAVIDACEQAVKNGKEREVVRERGDAKRKELAARREAGEIAPHDLDLNLLFQLNDVGLPLTHDDMNNEALVLTRSDFDSLGCLDFIHASGERMLIDSDSLDPDDMLILYPDEVGNGDAY